MVGGWEGGACGGWDCFGVGEGWKRDVMVILVRSPDMTLIGRFLTFFLTRPEYLVSRLEFTSSVEINNRSDKYLII